MKQLRTVFVSLIFIFFINTVVLADDFIMPDWGFYSFRENEKFSENADEISYEKIRNNQKFDEFFDKQTIKIFKNKKDISPQRAGMIYFANILNDKKYTEKYILKNTPDDFIGIYCSKEKKQGEIVRFYNGFDGLVEVKYTHNNLWHFQNNIGSFIATQMRIKHLPYEFMINEIVNKNRIIRL